VPRPSRFTIRAACALTGINQNTLRAWERRYGLIRPERTSKGYRMYSDEDIARLRLIQRAMREGVPIGRVHAHLQTPGTRERLEGGLAAQANPLAGCCSRIEAAARRLDRAALERAYRDAVSLQSVRDAFHQALGPALERICPHHGRTPCEATERFLVAFLRERLAGVLAGLRPLHQPPRALFACAPGETRETTLMLLSLEVGLEGLSARYLGTEATVEDLPALVESAGSRVLVLSATDDLPRDEVLALRERLAALPRRPRLLAEGAAARAERDWLAGLDVEALPPAPADAARRVLQAAGAV